MHSSFLSEYMADRFNGRDTNVPNPNNAVTQERLRMTDQLRKKSEQTGQPIEDIALGYIDSNRADIERYISTQNETPEEDTVKLALQAFELRQREIDSVSDTMGIDPEQALIFLEEADAQAKDQEHPDADNAIGGGLLAGVGAMASVGLGKLADDHAKKHGGKRGFAGTLADIFGALSNKDEQAAAKEDIGSKQNYDLAQLLKDTQQKVVDNKKGMEIKKMLPGIIIGVVVLIVVVVLITRSASKK